MAFLKAEAQVAPHDMRFVKNRFMERHLTDTKYEKQHMMVNMSHYPFGQRRRTKPGDPPPRGSAFLSSEPVYDIKHDLVLPKTDMIVPVFEKQ